MQHPQIPWVPGDPLPNASFVAAVLRRPNGWLRRAANSHAETTAILSGRPLTDTESSGFSERTLSDPKSAGSGQNLVDEDRPDSAVSGEMPAEEHQPEPFVLSTF